MNSLAESLASLPASKQAEIFADITEAQAAELLWRWDFWARPNQLPPEGNWSVWLILAGRGAGKTRTGSEWIRSIVCGKTPLAPGAYKRIALVAETAADARDVMVEGDSGILSVHPPDFRPTYEPSKRRLTWPNGAIATLFNGTEPDQLRGPQFDAAWCLTGDAVVSMANGKGKRIDQIAPGELVITRKGPRKVLASACTGKHRKILRFTLENGTILKGTENHRVYVMGRGWCRMDDIKSGERLCGLSTLSKGRTTHFGRLNIAHRSYGMAGSGGEISLGITKTTIANAYTARSTNLYLDRSRAVGISTMSTGTTRTTISAICRHYLPACTCPTQTQGKSTLNHGARGPANSPLSVGSSVKGLNASAISVAALTCLGRWLSQLASAQPNASISGAGTASRAKRASAITARPSITPHEVRSGSVRGPATTPSITGSLRRLASHAMSLAGIAGKFSEASASMRGSAEEVAQRPSTVSLRISRVEEWGHSDVYDITVEDAGEFFANGVLVHNCDEIAKYRYAQETWDMLQFGLRLGNDPRQMLTTTPRPIKLLKDILASPGTVVTRGSTYDNKSNLAPKFLATIEQKYAGTRLGRQELEAEILDDAPGALWTRSKLDAKRIAKGAKLPEMKRVVVAIDPASEGGGEGEIGGGAETGIIVAGLGIDGRGYVLDDFTCAADPNGWARRAVDAFDEYQADVIIAEKNQGGAMVEAVIRSVRRTIPFQAVHASRGKVTRAEPIAALYEQGRVSHVGTFSALEDQMVVFTPFGIEGGTTGDRVDALVWGLSQLFPGIIHHTEKATGTGQIKQDRWQRAFDRQRGGGDENSWKLR